MGKMTMPFKAAPIKISTNEEKILNEFAKSRTLPLNKIQRSRIILEASKGKNNKEISKEVGLNQDSVSKWRTRWAKNAEQLREIEEKNPQDLLHAVENLLKDAPRPGPPCRITEVQIIKILEIACRHPCEFGYESSHWSTPQLAKVVVSLGIIDKISYSSIGRFLKDGSNSTAQGKILATLNR
jgi:transposase